MTSVRRPELIEEMQHLVPDPVRVDRGTDRYRRIRDAVGDGHAPYIDPDRVADDITHTVERLDQRRPRT